MNSEDRFKKTLKELIASKEFPFDAANWAQASQMIDAAKERRRGGPFFIAAALLILSGLSAYYFLSGIPEKSSPAQAGRETLAEAAPSAANPVTPEKSFPETIPAQRVETPESKTSSQTAETPDPVPSVAESSAPAEAHAEKIPDTNSYPQNNSVNPVPAPIEAITGIQAPATISMVNPVTTGAPQTQQAESTSETPVANQTASESNKMLSTQLSESSTKSMTPAKSDESISDINPLLSATEPIQTNPAVTTANSGKKEDASPALATLAPDSVKKAEPAKADSPVELLPADNDGGQIGKPKHEPVLASIEAGANYMLGWQNSAGRDAGGFNPLIGVNYFNHINEKMDFSFGLHYTTISNLSFSNYTSRVTRLGFGEESQVTVFTPTKVHYLFVPLRWNYNITPMNTIGVGCNIAYLLTVDSDVESYTESLNTKQNATLSQERGYTQGFKKYDSQVSVFYKRRLYPQLAVNIEFYCGLTDVKDNTFFNSNGFERNSGAKLTLVYNFLKK